MRFEAVMMHAFMAAMVLLLGVLAMLMPRLTRPDLWFSVTVAPGFRDSEAGRRILRSYRLLVAGWMVGALVLVGAGVATGAPILSALAVFVLSTGYGTAFLAARRRTAPHAVAPSTVREAELSPRRSSLPGGAILQAGPFAILLAAAAWVAARWDRLPARVPTHWSLGGVPDAWAARSPAAVFAPTVTGLVTCALLALLGWGLLRRSRRIHAAGAPARAEHRFRRTVVGVLVAAEYLVALNLALLSVLPLVRHLGAALWAIPVVGLAFAVATIAVLARGGQGGARLAPAASGPRPVGDRTPDATWKLGIFYVNRDDPALFVEKRFGIGYTINLGNPWSWLLLAAIVVVPLVVTFVLRHSS